MSKLPFQKQIPTYHDVVVIQLVAETNREIGLRVALDGDGHLSGNTRRIAVQSRALKVFVVVLWGLGGSQLDMNLRYKSVNDGNPVGKMEG